MDYLLHILILIAIYSLLGLSLDLAAGYTGLVSLAHAAFYGLGAYTAALLALHTGSPFLLNLLSAAAVTAAAGALVGWPALRIRDDYFVIATFAFQVIAQSLLKNLTSVTGGPLGLPGIPPPEIFGWKLDTKPELLALALSLTAVGLVLTQLLVRSPVGRILQAVREDEVLALATGKRVARAKILAFALSSCGAGVAGAMFAHYMSFIDPSSFTVMESILIVCIIIVGGAGSTWGALVGAALLFTVQELLRFLGVPAALAATLRQMLYGLLLIGLMLWRPQGLLGRYDFQEQ